MSEANNRNATLFTAISSSGYLGISPLKGSSGNDFYDITNSDQTIEEAANGGIDTVRSYIASYTLGANLENLVLMTGAMNGTGNNLNNIIDGNNLNNNLNGGAGNDTLRAGAGDDNLDGGTGADLMIGGAGADTYYVDNVGDVVQEDLADENTGRDKVIATINYALPSASVSNVEDLELRGSATRGVGNELHNNLLGNTNNNWLDAGEGNDSLDGGSGNDTLLGGNGNNVLNGGAGTDTANYSFATDSVRVDLLEGKARTQQTLFEGYLGASTPSRVGAGNLLQTDLSFELDGGYIFGGLLAKEIASSATQNNARTIWVAGFDGQYTKAVQVTLSYNAAADETSAKVLQAKYASGDVRTSINFDTAGTTMPIAVDAQTAGYNVMAIRKTLGTDTLSNIENLVGSAYNDNLRGDANANAIDAGAGNDTIFSGAGNDTLNGGPGIDFMAGGAGADTYYVDNPKDWVHESWADQATGNDKVFSSVNFDLPGSWYSNIEDLQLTGTAQRAKGNELNNFLTGNALDNVLNGSSGRDTISGGLGDDIIIPGLSNDKDDYQSDYLGGGAGADLFVMSSPEVVSNGDRARNTIFIDDERNGYDRLSDFQLDIDKIGVDISQYSYLKDQSIQAITDNISKYFVVAQHWKMGHWGYFSFYSQFSYLVTGSNVEYYSWQNEDYSSIDSYQRTNAIRFLNGKYRSFEANYWDENSTFFDLKKNILLFDGSKEKTTVTISDDQVAATNGLITYNIVFSQNVTGFDASKVLISSGEKISFVQNSPSDYTLRVMPLQNNSAGLIDLTLNTTWVLDSYNNSAISPDVYQQAFDTRAAKISSVSLSSATGIQNKRLNMGDTVLASVVFDNDVQVTGTPTLTLNIENKSVLATYQSSSNGKTLNFAYTIQSAENDSNGISIAANGLSLNGGSITDAGNARNAYLAHKAVADNTGYAVDTAAPSATLLAGSGNNKGIAKVQSSEVGSAYLVKTSVQVLDEASIQAAADALWNKATISTANSQTNLGLAGLSSGVYKLYTVDLAGNLSDPSTQFYTVL